MSQLRSTYRRARRLVRRAIGRDIQFPIQIERQAIRYGSENASWSICPDDIGPASVFYSAGIGTDISFDLALIERYGLTVHAFDPTPASIEWLQARSWRKLFTWRQVGLAAYDGQAMFFPPENPAWVSPSMLRAAPPAPGCTRWKYGVRRRSCVSSGIPALTS